MVKKYENIFDGLTAVFLCNYLLAAMTSQSFLYRLIIIKLRLQDPYHVFLSISK